MKPKVLGNCKKGLLFVVSAPAGTGKTTLVRLLTEEFSCVVESISFTTRPPRVGEQEGKDYYFITKEVFEDKLQKAEFLESADVFGHLYGTSKELVESTREQGKHVVLVIDTQGALYLQTLSLDATYIFIAPPSLEILEERLLQRKTEDDGEREKRLSWAHKELEVASCYDFLIINSDLKVAYQVLKSILIAEEHRITKSFKGK
jgi:guanylate kinase